MVLNTPPMGWNTWNTFGPNINEQLIMETADAMADKGLLEAGYEYIVIDDGWSLKSRDENDNLAADPEKFPHGIKYLADYIHSKGLKFGIYSSCGGLTCQGYPGSLDHEYQDAKFFVENGVDYLKYDWCYHPKNTDGWVLYNRMKMALNATGKNVLFSICNWGEEDTTKWARRVGGDMYRSTGDICDNFEIVKDIVRGQSCNFCLSGPSCYNDIDMLVCGMYSNTSCDDVSARTQYETHFKLWCMLSAPLMIGCDIRNADENTLALLKNRAYLSINRDAEQRPPIRVNAGDNNVIMLFKHLANGEYAVSMSNFESNVNGYKVILLAEIGFPGDGEWGLELTDIETGETRIYTTNIWPRDIMPYETKLYRGRAVKLR